MSKVRPLIDSNRRSQASFACMGRMRDGSRVQWTWQDLIHRLDHAIDRLLPTVDERRRLICKSDNSLDSVVEMIAAMDQNWIHCPIDSRLPTDVIQRRTMAIAFASLPERTGYVLWTSGSRSVGHTGGRGVCLDNRGFWHNAAAKLKRVPQRRQDIRMTVLPISHAYARTCDVGTWLLSGCGLIVGLGFADLREYSTTYRITHINTVPTMARKIRSLTETHALQVLGIGGAALDQESFEHWQNRGVSVVQGYGCTETGPVICSASIDDGVAGLVGKPVNGWDIRIDHGQLSVRGPALLLGYIGGDDALDDDALDDDGYFCTGDQVRQCANGQLQLLGRSDDQLTFASGVTTMPLEVEQAFASEFPEAGLVMLRCGIGGVPEMWTANPMVSTRWRGGTTWTGAIVKVQTFEPPLSPNELTIKGDIRRSSVERNRFSK